jgi:hypothetical protein
MISTTVLLTIVLPAYALVAGAFYALVGVLGQRLDRFEARVDARFDRVESELAGLKAAVATLESRG